MTEAIEHIISNLLSFWILILITKYVCSAHFAIKKRYFITMAIVSAIFPALFPNYASLCLIGMVVLSILICSPRKVKDLLLLLPAFALYLTFSVIPLCILEGLFPDFKGQITFHNTTINLLSLIMDILLLCSLLVLGYIIRKYENALHLTKKEFLGYIGLSFFAFVDGALLYAANYESMAPIYAFIWKVVFLGAFLFTVGYFFYTLIESRVQIHRQTLSRNEIELLQIQLDALQDVKANETQIKHLRHDLNNHLTIIQTLCDNGEYEQVRQYAQQLRNNVVLSTGNISTGNNIADLILASKAKIANTHGIEFTFSGSLANLEGMSAPDICGLLSNAYDNAIEACLTQTNSYIRTEVSSSRNYTVIQISNSLDKSVTVQGNHVRTTKKDKSVHGYGLDIMKRIAHKYNGQCTISSKENEFIVKIVLLKSS